MKALPIAAAAIAVSLAACGGGSGNSVPSASPTSGAQPQSQIAQSASEAAFGYSSAAEADQATSGTNAGILSLSSSGARPQSFGNLPYGQCVPDGTYAGMILAQPQTAGSVTTYEITYFRDPQCASKARDITVTVTKNGQGSYAVSRLATNYDASGNQLAQRNSSIAVTGTKHNFSAQSTSVLSYQGATVGSAIDERSTTSSATPNVDSFTGDGARITNGASNAYGESHAVGAGATKTFNADGSVTYAFTSTQSLFMGSAGALAFSPSTFPGPFTITPSSDATGSGSLSWTETFDADGLPTSIAVSGSLAQGATLAVTTSAGPPVVFNGTVSGSSGSVLATFQVDQYGNGSVSFADGSKRSIYDWHAFKS
jgi:hypothetical protein